MKKILSVLCFFMVGMVGTVGATPATIDPETGWSGQFFWYDGLHKNISLTQDEDWVQRDGEWMITVEDDSTMSSIKAWDEYNEDGYVGSEFDFYVDGSKVAWDGPPYTYVDKDGYFHAEKKDLFLSAGDHSFTFFITQLDMNTSGEQSLIGGGGGLFSSVVSAPVPEPATFFLLGFGVLGVAIGRKRLSGSFS